MAKQTEEDPAPLDWNVQCSTCSHEKVLHSEDGSSCLFEPSCACTEYLDDGPDFLDELIHDLGAETGNCDCGGERPDVPHKFGEPGCEYHDHHCDSCHEKKFCTKEECQ